MWVKGVEHPVTAVLVLHVLLLLSAVLSLETWKGAGLRPKNKRESAKTTVVPPSLCSTGLD